MKKILEDVKHSIKEFSEIYKKLYKELLDEVDTHYYLYGIFFKIGLLITPKNYTGVKGDEILLHTEWPTKNTAGRFDFVIYSPDTIKDDRPFIAIELKQNKDFRYKRVKTGIEADFKKLSTEKIDYPIFIYVDKDKPSCEYRSFLQEMKAKYPKIDVYFITPLGMEPIV